MMLRVACIQMNAGPDIPANLEAAEAMIRQAAAQGAQFVATPENTCHMRFPSREKLASAPREEGHPGVSLFSALARELGIHILAGSMAIRLDGEEKLANRSFLFDDTGAVAARYDKIHLFDVDLPTGERHRESDIIRPGAQAVVAQTKWGGVGLSVCYDVRFARLYRDLAQGGAAILTVPAAFTVPTGQAHWHVLLRARAIETGSFVIAPAQCGEHQGGRKTYGHSLIVGPWGDILAEAGEETGIIIADLDPGAVARAREAIPALRHDRDYALPGITGRV